MSGRKTFEEAGMYDVVGLENDPKTFVILPVQEPKTKLGVQEGGGIRWVGHDEATRLLDEMAARLLAEEGVSRPVPVPEICKDDELIARLLAEEGVSRPVPAEEGVSRPVPAEEESSIFSFFTSFAKGLNGS